MLDFVLSFMLILIHEYCSFLALQELQCQQEVLMNNILAQQEFRVFKERCLLSFQLHMPDPVLPNQWYCLDDYPSPPLSIVGCTLELSNTAEASRKKKCNIPFPAGGRVELTDFQDCKTDGRTK